MAPTLPIAALLSSIPGARRREKARDGSRVPQVCFCTWGLYSCSFLSSNFYFLSGQRRAELAGGEIFQGAEASVEFGGRQAPQAVERPQKIRRWSVTLARVASKDNTVAAQAL